MFTYKENKTLSTSLDTSKTYNDMAVHLCNVAFW